MTLGDIIECHVISQIQLSTEMKGLLRGVRKGRSESVREKASSQPKSFPKQEN